MIRTVTLIAGFAFAASCTTIPTNGNDTSFTREGTLSCPDITNVDPDLMIGTEQDPVRCGPQSVPITQ